MASAKGETSATEWQWQTRDSGLVTRDSRMCREMFWSTGGQ